MWNPFKGTTKPKPEPEPIPFMEPPYEKAVNKVLALALERAKEVEVGETFQIDPERSDIPATAFYFEILYPLARCAAWYDLEVSPSDDDWTFEFTKLSPSPSLA